VDGAGLSGERGAEGAEQVVGLDELEPEAAACGPGVAAPPGGNVLAIPGTSSVAHLRKNLAAADLELPAGDAAR
jgi:aryl-alcohol dehydrogenase-like predicted oxidoreductase